MCCLRAGTTKHFGRPSDSSQDTDIIFRGLTELEEEKKLRGSVDVENQVQVQVQVEIGPECVICHLRLNSSVPGAVAATTTNPVVNYIDEWNAQNFKGVEMERVMAFVGGTAICRERDTDLQITQSV